MSASSFRWLACLLGLAAVAAGSELDREIVLAPLAGDTREDLEIRRDQERAGAAGATRADYERLAWAFVAKARRTLDAGYYALALKAADVTDERLGADDDSRLLRGHVLHNLHRFREAEAIAGRLAATRGQPEDFALLSDARMEQGDLAGAVDACQRLVNLRPGFEAWSRIAHLRWLKGDLVGATAAMEEAMRAAGANDAEGNAWALTRLSGYYLQAGRADAALTAAEAALRHAALYPPAMLARGRALLASRQGEAAVEALRRAAELNPLPEYQWWLADALRANGRDAEATRVEGTLVRRGESADPRTLALFLATRGVKPADAVRLARGELSARADVFTHDALAWALAANGEFAAADAEMKLALREGTRDARLCLHAALIAQRCDQPDAAARYFAAARGLAGTLTPSERARLEAPVRNVAAN